MARTRITLPKTVFSVLGPVRVDVVKNLTKSDEAIGMFDFSTRQIKLDADNSAEAQVQTLFHEIAHVALMDGGAHHSLTHEQREAVCDAVGTYLAAAYFNNKLTIK